MGKNPVLSVENLAKQYGLEWANKNVSIDFLGGRIHAIVGENGAGKSTLMKMIFGLERPDDGAIYCNGKPADIATPQAAKNLGIAMVHQHFMLAENLSVEDHLRLEVNSRRKVWGIGDFDRYSARILELKKLLTFDVTDRTLVRHLSVIQKQKLEILKTLLFDPQILIFDEPTAILPPNEVVNFYKLAQQLKQKPACIIIVTHKLQEVMSYADDVTVLRRGEVKFQSAVSDTSANEIACHMVGESVFNKKELSPAATNRQIHKSSGTLANVRNFSLSHPSWSMALHNLNFTVDAGEIVAFAGVEGNGQSEVLKSFLFPELADEGHATGEIELLNQITISDGASKINHTEVRNFQLGWIGEDRLSQSAIEIYGLPDHFRLLPFYRRQFRLQTISSEILTHAQTSFDIRPLSLDLSVGHFSGGNQQKWVVARETSHSPKLLLAAYPTRGVDFAAAARIHSIMRSLRSENKSVILVSSDLDEISELADRILVFYKGRIIREFTKPFSREAIGEEMGGRSYEAAKQQEKNP